MTAITEKMRELMREKEEQERQQQQQRDSDTLSTIVMPPVTAEPRPIRPDVLRGRGFDVDRAGGVLQRVETELATGSTAERPRIDRPASDGDNSDDSGTEVGGGRPGHLKRWPAPDGTGLYDDDTNKRSDNNNRRPAGKHAPAVSRQTDSQQTTPTATPDDSQTDSSSSQQRQPVNVVTLVSRATVI